VKHQLIASFEGPDLRAIARAVLGWPTFEGARTPRRYTLGDRREQPPADWKQALIEAGEGSAFLSPEGAPTREECRIGIAAGVTVTVFAPGAFDTAADVARLVADVPFTVATFGDVFRDEWREIEHPTYGFANSHTRLGWGCAFKGAGHDRLVSRRWLDFGPWRVMRCPGDMTIVQFHDLTLSDAADALAQALPGHERMGISDIGGFIQGPSAAGRGIKYVVAEKLPEGLYDAATRTLEVVVPPGRTISQGEMQDACAYRLNKRHDKAKPIERIAYVFIDEENASAHLHELWLREFEVWTVEGGEKRRIDLDYNPKPNPPEWVRSLQGRGASS